MNNCIIIILVQGVACVFFISILQVVGWLSGWAQCLPARYMDRDPFPRDFEPSKSICCSVGLEGDFKTLTREEGEHGWAVTKLMSYRSEKVAVSIFSPSIET